MTRKLITFLMLCSFAHAQFMGSSGNTSPQLPTKWMATTINSTNFPGLFSSPVSKTVKSSGGDYTTLTAAVAAIGTDAPSCNEIITVDAGYTSDTLGNGATINFTKTCPAGNYVWIRSSGYLSLPAQGTRVSASNTNMFTIVKSVGDDFPILFQDGKNAAQARGYIFTGMELNIQPAAIHYGVAIGNADNTTTTYADHIIFDRCWMHYTAGTGGEMAQMVSMQGTWNAIVDSYIDGVHTKSVGIGESHGIWVNSGPGPFKIVNNYIGDAPTENIFYGGQDPSVANVLPRDSEIRRNTLFKDWTLLAQGYCVKNLLELKNAARVLADGNVAEYSWNVNCGGGGQSGNAITFSPVNQNNNCLWCSISDVIVSNSDFQNMGGYYVTLNGHPGVGTIGAYPVAQRIAVINTVFRGMNQTTFNTGQGGSAVGGFAYNDGGKPLPGQSAPGPFDVTFSHVGIYASATNNNYWMSLAAAGTGAICTFGSRYNLTFKASIVLTDNTGGEIKGDCGLTLDQFTTTASYGTPFAGTSKITGNVMVGVTAWTNGKQSNNFFPTGTASSPPTNLFTSYASCAGTAPALPGAISNCALLGTDTACSGASCHNNPQCDNLDCGPDIAKITAAQIEPNDSTKWGPRSLQ